MMNNKIYATVDPGINTYIVLWNGDELIEVVGFRVKKKENQELSQSLHTSNINFSLCLADLKHKPETIYIEGVQLFSSLKSLTSAKRGNLFSLSYRVGGYFAVATSNYHILTDIIPPNVWKGSMSDEQVKYRVERVMNQSFKNIHIYCAVGIGLYLQGRL